MQILKENIKEDIINAAIEHFTENGYQKASMSSIAKTAGISVGNLYRYFKNKDALIEEILLPVFEEIQDFLSHISLDILQDKNTKVLEEMVLQFVKMCEKYEKRFNILVSDYNQSISLSLHKQLVEVFVSHINQIVPTTLPLTDTELTLRRALASSWISGLSQIINHYYKSPEILQTLLNRYALIIIEGLKNTI